MVIVVTKYANKKLLATRPALCGTEGTRVKKERFRKQGKCIDCKFYANIPNCQCCGQVHHAPSFAQGRYNWEVPPRGNSPLAHCLVSPFSQLLVECALGAPRYGRQKRNGNVIQFCRTPPQSLTRKTTPCVCVPVTHHHLHPAASCPGRCTFPSVLRATPNKRAHGETPGVRAARKFSDFKCAIDFN